MTFLAGGALAGLALLAPLVILHLRQRAGRAREVPSLLLWHEFELDALGRGRRVAPPPLPLLLALQAVALILLVLALAEPILSGAAPVPATVIVLDDSFWMTAPGAAAAARREVDRVLRSVPASSTVRIVLADGAPSVVYHGSPARAAVTVSRWRANNAPADLSLGLAVASGLLRGPRDRIVLVRAPQDRPPAVSAGPGELRTLVAGSPEPDLGIFDPLARCGIGAPAACEVVATVVNTGSTPAAAHVVAAVSGDPSSSQVIEVGAGASAHIQFPAPAGKQMRLALSGSDDALSVDDTAWVTVPGDDDIPRSATVTVVGTPAQARSLAQAFAAVPGVTLKLRTPADYRAGVARSSDLVVLDGRLPHGGLPPAPAVLLVDPDRLPGGRVAGAQADPTLSGVDATSPLLENADLSSLTIDRGAARRLSLPPWLVRVLWSPSGPLLAAGDAGHGRLIVTAFQPGGSTLAQLTAFPVLAANIVRWSLGWAPQSGSAGAAIAVDALPGARVATLARHGTTVDRVELGRDGSVLQAPAPGTYTVTESGPGVSHRATIDVNLGSEPAASPVPIDLRATQLRSAQGPRTPLTPWLLGAALVVLALEWVYWSVRGARVFA